MFPRACLILTTLLILSSVATYFFEVRLRPEDEVHFKALIQESVALRHKKTLEQTPAHQERQGVQKDIWTDRHFQIQSERSHLLLSQIKEKIEAKEELEKIRGSIGEDLHLTADEGFYTLSSEHFTAQKNCLLTQNDNWIRGDQIDLDFAEETVLYKNPTGFLTPFHFSAKQLVWHKKEDRIDLSEQITIEQPDQFTLHADRGTLTAASLFLEGNVHLHSSRIQDKESFAIADTLTYNLQDQTLLFTSPRKVLFWQEGLQLSAAELLIRQDRSVEGKGNVHFTFDLEEQKSIDQILGKFL